MRHIDSIDIREKCAILLTAKKILEKNEKWRGNQSEFVAFNKSQKDLPQIIYRPDYKVFTSLADEFKKKGINFRIIFNGTAPRIYEFTRDESFGIESKKEESNIVEENNIVEEKSRMVNIDELFSMMKNMKNFMRKIECNKGEYDIDCCIKVLEALIKFYDIK